MTPDREAAIEAICRRYGTHPNSCGWESRKLDGILIEISALLTECEDGISLNSFGDESDETFTGKVLLSFATSGSAEIVNVLSTEAKSHLRATLRVIRRKLELMSSLQPAYSHVPKGLTARDAALYVLACEGIHT